jgi:hypothetical protein
MAGYLYFVGRFASLFEDKTITIYAKILHVAIGL